jgi:uncharacterized membrane protein HdeD (DUF308 family)
MGLLTGIVAIVGGFRGGGAASIVFGVLSAAIGLLLLFYPQDSFSTMVTIVGIIMMVQGVVAGYLAVTTK